MLAFVFEVLSSVMEAAFWMWVWHWADKKDMKRRGLREAELSKGSRA